MPTDEFRRFYNREWRRNHRERCREQRRQIYIRYKEAGICVTCGKAKARSGYTRCLACAVREAQARAAKKEREHDED